MKRFVLETRTQERYLRKLTVVSFGLTFASLRLLACCLCVYPWLVPRDSHQETDLQWFR